MTEQPLWHRQQAALAAEQDAPLEVRASTGNRDPTEPPAYTSGYGTDTPASVGWGVWGINEWAPTGYPMRPDFPGRYTEPPADPPMDRDALIVYTSEDSAHVIPAEFSLCVRASPDPSPPPDPDTAEFSPAERKALRALLHDRGLTT
jgi:hypothetical protein